MSQSVAGTLNQYPNLIELIGRHSELLGTAVWSEPAIGSDDPSIGSDDVSDGVPGTHDNILQDDMNGPLIAVSVTCHEAIGQDDFGSPAAVKLDRMPICSDDETIGQDDISGIAQVGTNVVS